MLGEKLHAIVIAAAGALEHRRRISSPKAPLRSEGFDQVADIWLDVLVWIGRGRKHRDQGQLDVDIGMFRQSSRALGCDFEQIILLRGASAKVIHDDAQPRMPLRNFANFLVRIGRV